MMFTRINKFWNHLRIYNINYQKTVPNQKIYQNQNEFIIKIGVVDVDVKKHVDLKKN